MLKKALIQGEVNYVSNSFTTAAPCDAVKAGNSWVLDDLVISNRLLLFQQNFSFWRMYSKFKFLNPGGGEEFLTSMWQKAGEWVLGFHCGFHLPVDAK